MAQAGIFNILMSRQRSEDPVAWGYVGLVAFSPVSIQGADGSRDVHVQEARVVLVEPTEAWACVSNGLLCKVCPQGAPQWT